jgi:hypothetical protein
MAPDASPELADGPDTIVIHQIDKPMIFDPDGGDRFIWKNPPVRPSSKF